MVFMFLYFFRYQLPLTFHIFLFHLCMDSIMGVFIYGIISFITSGCFVRWRIVDWISSHPSLCTANFAVLNLFFCIFCHQLFIFFAFNSHLKWYVCRDLINQDQDRQHTSLFIFSIFSSYLSIILVLIVGPSYRLISFLFTVMNLISISVCRYSCL